jgi:hypothetical protein
MKAMVECNEKWNKWIYNEENDCEGSHSKWSLIVTWFQNPEYADGTNCMVHVFGALPWIYKSNMMVTALYSIILLFFLSRCCCQHFDCCLHWSSSLFFFLVIGSINVWSILKRVNVDWAITISRQWSIFLCSLFGPSTSVSTIMDSTTMQLTLNHYNHVEPIKTVLKKA